MDFTLLSTLAVIHCLALISPGPDFAIIVKTSTQQSRQTALMCAAGISASILIHSLLSLLGISIMIKQSELAYFTVQIIGVSYLAWMGFGALASAVKSFQNKSEPSEVLQTRSAKANISFDAITPAKGFKIGLYTNLLNPKALIFFITIFTVLVTPEVTASTKIASASLLFILSLIWFCFLALILTKPAIQNKMSKGSNIIDAITGVIFIGVALTILLSLIQQLLVS
ncbi:LysE family transporter [Shewanella goraebulensis]|uniref:LysE family transporter n=1 Tax=Shewanella goraebulensis TaxID=3050637 RepID=UPI00254C5369|nr:LysE family transporter [Shewanella goraebulensis]